MDTALVVALISALVAVASAALSVWNQRSLATRVEQRARENEARAKREAGEAILSRYRDPLLQAAFELQSRIFNILRTGLLRMYFGANERQREYMIENTLYVFAQYFAWTEIIRTDVQFLDLQEVDQNRRLSELQQKIQTTFLSNALPFQIFRGEQRAIGEIMIDREDGISRCLGFASFVAKKDHAFRYWFEQLREDITDVIEGGESHVPRLTAVHHTLIDLIEFLDPAHTHFPPDTISRLGDEPRRGGWPPAAP